MRASQGRVQRVEAVQQVLQGREGERVAEHHRAPAGAHDEHFAPAVPRGPEDLPRLPREVGEQGLGLRVGEERRRLEQKLKDMAYTASEKKSFGKKKRIYYKFRVNYILGSFF